MRMAGTKPNVALEKEEMIYDCSCRIMDSKVETLGLAIEYCPTHQNAFRMREALEKIARSAPCKEGHMSFNTPEQECDQRIAESALASPEEEVK